MSRDKQIEEMASILMDRCNCAVTDCSLIADCDICRAEHLYNAGYRKQEWISVEKRLPEVEEEEITIVHTEGEIKGLAKISELVLIFSAHPKGDYVTIDRTVDGQWANNWFVTHWMPLPEAPKMKGGAE